MFSYYKTVRWHCVHGLKTVRKLATFTLVTVRPEIGFDGAISRQSPCVDGANTPDVNELVNCHYAISLDAVIT